MEYGSYTTVIGGKKYIVRIGDADDICIPAQTHDVIQYEVDMDDKMIYAKIINPSQHTLYLIEQGRCYIGINYRNMRGHSPLGYHHFGYDEYDHAIAHSSGLGRGSYRFHYRWSVYWRVGNNDNPIKITDPDETIAIPFTFWWIGGLYKIWRTNRVYERESRDTWYFDIRIALGSKLFSDNSFDQSRMRVYQTKSKITRIFLEID